MLYRGRWEAAASAAMIVALSAVLFAAISPIQSAWSPAQDRHTMAPAPETELASIAMLPNASGTVAYFPEFGILEAAPVGGMIIADYFKTTEFNREFRRGFLEFAIPTFSGDLLGATLVLPELGGWTGYPMPPDLFELSYYEADIAITTADYDQSTTLLASFEMDANVADEVFTIDITDLVIAQQGLDLGFRIKLAVDPTYNETGGWLGTGFNEPVAGDPCRIEVDLSVPAAPPVANGGPDLDVRAGETAEFNGSKSSDNVGVVNWTWSFSEAGTSHTLYGSMANWTFTWPGAWNVTLTVRDAAGYADVDWLEVLVLNVAPPEAMARASPNPVESGDVVVFSGAGSTDDVGIVNYTWSFIDGTERIRYGERIEYAFEETGTYEVTLTVRDVDGNTDTDLVLITVEEGGAEAGAVGQALPTILGIVAVVLALAALLVVLFRKR